MNNTIEELRNFINSQNADAILINSADEFLSEYNILSLNSRYKVTGFSGSMGDCIVTKDKVYQIADGRYHEQAEKEVDNDVVTVLKMKQGDSPIGQIFSVLDENSTLIVTANKVSVDFCEKLKQKTDEKNISIKYINTDPVSDLAQNTYTNVPLVLVDEKIAELSPEKKFEMFAEMLSDKQILLVTSPVNFAYLTNLRNYDFPYSSAPRAKAIIYKNKMTIYSDSKIPFNFEKLKLKKLKDFKHDLVTILGKEILVDKKSFSQSDFLQIHPSSKVVQSNIFDIKSEKRNSEIEHLKNAFNATDRVLKKMNDLINSNEQISEYDLYCAITDFFTQEGAVSQSFKPIIASGANSSIIHYSAASPSKIIKDGDLVMIDCGGYFEGGLATDITRTFVKGTPSDEQKRIYTKVLQAFIASYTKKYSDDVTWQEIDLTTRKKLTSEEKNGFLFSHSTGHGIGISVHENPPVCAPFDTYAQPFKENYVFSIEPGLYKQGVFGVRIENAVYVKSLKPFNIEVLTHFPFEEKLIEKSMLTKKEIKFVEDWQNYGKKNNLC